MGARCSVLVKNLRPSRKIKERILNPLPRQRVTNLVVTRRAIVTEGCATGEAGTTRGALEDDGPPHADADDILLYR